MTNNELSTTLQSLFAYDIGHADSGIHDAALKDQCRKYLESVTDEVGRRRLLARMVRELWLCDESIDAGYGCEDALTFINWLEDEFGLL
jgi:hypothetical protein